MKSAVLAYAPEGGKINIGDYTQSLAASFFLTKFPEVFIERDEISSYNGDEVLLIMNGWFMVHPKNYPPSDCIHPIFISHHINVLAQKEFSKKAVIEYYKKFQPIGCRDYSTKEFLEKHGVDCYYSGCLTLTLSHFLEKSAPTNEIIFIDPRFPKEKGMRRWKNNFILLFSKFGVINQIRKRYRKSLSFRSWKKTLEFYKCYSKVFSDDVLCSATYLKNFIPKKDFQTEVEILEYAKNYVKRLSSAKMVVTTRIHAALPALSFDVPVLLAERPEDDEISTCRFRGIYELFHRLEFRNGKLSCKLIRDDEKIDKNFLIKNPQDYQKVKENLITKMADYRISEKLSSQ